MSFRNSVTCDNADLERVGGACDIKADGLGFADRDKAMCLKGVGFGMKVLQSAEYGDKPETLVIRAEAMIDAYLEEQYAG